jgi:hypothetical protein
MAEAGTVEQTVSRAVRDNLSAVTRLTEELNQALGDLSAACSSSKPSNALPAMLRAQTSAAALAASLEVLTRFVASTMGAVSRIALEPAAAPAGVPAVGSAAAETAADAGREMGSEGGPLPIPTVKIPQVAPPPAPAAAPPPAPAAEPAPAAPVLPKAVSIAEAAKIAEAAPAFDISKLGGEEQELHRRANRVAKVCMQDIKMLRPDDIKVGREKKDLCVRLKADLDKARKEYDRRFKSILSHPVDYFYDWMVDIIADGDPKALGDYPYPTSAPRR